MERLREPPVVTRITQHELTKIERKILEKIFGDLVEIETINPKFGARPVERILECLSETEEKYRSRVVAVLLIAPYRVQRDAWRPLRKAGVKMIKSILRKDRRGRLVEMYKDERGNPVYEVERFVQIVGMTKKRAFYKNLTNHR